ncbi:MAG: hypothetical protein AAF604_17900 [Acidobacteriota bacterium]
MDALNRQSDGAVISRDTEGPSPGDFFCDYAAAHPELLDLATFEPLTQQARQIFPRLVDDAEDGYGLHPWPIFVDQPEAAALARAVTGLAALHRQLPARFFDNDPDQLRRFYGLESDLLARLLVTPPTGVDALFVRGDFIATAHGWRCIELNFGNLGGMQYAPFADLYRDFPPFADFARDRGFALDHPSTLRAMFRHALAHRQVVPDAGPYHLAIVTADDQSMNSALGHNLELYRRILAEEAAAGDTVLHLLSDNDLEFRRRRVQAHGQRLHGIIEQSDRDTSRQMFRAFKAGSIDLYSCPVSMILGDKRNLGLLSQHGESDRFSPEERRLIADFVPWSRRIEAGPVTFRGRTLAMPELLRQEREALVLKAGDALGGTAVVIGPKTSSQDWQRAIDHALGEGSWMVQEYLEPQPYPLLRPGRGIEPHDIVWGAFAFGDEFGGLFARLAARRDTNGILNLSGGAQVGVPFLVHRSRRPRRTQ